jgi:SEC-C motif
MGPTIILDKSSLQSLSQDEIHFLHKYYLVNIPPILVMEILADLKKESSDHRSSQQIVAQLSKKLLNNDSALNVYYGDLIINELLGHPINLSGRTMISQGDFCKEGDKKGMTFEVSPEEKAINNWKKEKFSDAENDLAMRWRLYSESLSPDRFKNENKRITVLLQNYKTLEELDILINSIITIKEIQTILLMIIINENKISQELASKIFYLWESRNKPLLITSYPYSIYCMRALLLYYYGTLKDLFGRATDRLDLEYTYYLPFTNIFSSDDKFLKKFIPFVKDNEKTFVTGKELKTDFSQIVSEWKVLSVEDKIKWHENNGNEPFKITPLTVSLWKKHWPNWTPGVSHQKKKPDLTIDELNFKRGRRVKGDPSAKDIEDIEKGDIDFLEIEREISINDPCPCGSGVSFKECHYKKGTA